MNLKDRKIEVDKRFQELNKKKNSFLNEIAKISEEMMRLRGAYEEIEYWEKLASSK